MTDRNEFEDLHLPPINGRQLRRLQVAVDAALAANLKVDGQYDIDSRECWRDLRERVLRPVIVSPTPPAPTIESLPPEEQHDEALGRLRDAAEWLRSERLNEGRGARSLGEAVDDAADELDREGYGRVLS